MIESDMIGIIAIMKNLKIQTMTMEGPQSFATLLLTIP